MSDGKHWTENFRIFTPILVTIACFMLGNLISTVNKIDDKLFKHLTNEEIHAPRSMYVPATTFDLYQKMRDKEMATICAAVVEIRDTVKELKK